MMLFPVLSYLFNCIWSFLEFIINPSLMRNNSAQRLFTAIYFANKYVYRIPKACAVNIKTLIGSFSEQIH